MTSFLDELNNEQRQAVLKSDGPLLILAGAGAGKTKTVTYRILNLIRNGADPASILAITFTNKAAKEMRERVMKLISDDPELNAPVSFSERPFVSTFHSLGVHILKENSVLLDVPRHFSIFDKDDSKRAIKEAVREAGYDPKQFDPGKIQHGISTQKGNFVSLAEFEERAGRDYFPKIVAEIWKHYEALLRKEKAFDFDDLLLKSTRLLQKNEEVRRHYQNIWKYVHIDEYQDTNKVQYVMARLLTEGHGNICVVGDADQNIYSWRGAQIRNILDFEKDYPGATVILLEQNYRSTQNILSAANTIIKKNKHRKEKNLFTKNEQGEKISLFEAYDEANEASFIAEKAQKLINEGVPGHEIAVLYRANFQSRSLEEAFLSRNIPYHMLGTRFFERKEVKDILSFIRAALNPDSLSDIKRVVNVPPRGIGKVTLLKMFEGKEETLSPAVREKVKNFRSLLTSIRDTALSTKPSELVKYIMRESGLELSLKQGIEDDLERLENLQELVTLATRYDMFPPEEAIEKLLTDASLASDQDELDTVKKGVKLMTVHASKGLEFDYVFITGLEENLFPHKRMSESAISEEQEEEERRLFYVAITRARKKLFLSYAQARTIFGQRQMNMPSEFIFDIDDELIEKEYGSKGARSKPLYSIDF